MNVSNNEYFFHNETVIATLYFAFGTEEGPDSVY